MDNLIPATIDIYEEATKMPDWQMDLAFTEARHLEPIKGVQPFDECWRLKERMKTVSVALVLCLNVGVDPPDVVKTQPCAKLECWFDPQSKIPQKSIEIIGAQLEKQYERWQAKARYKKCLDPTVEEVKKLCVSLRRNAKEDRVLFHYNGHGVPKPTNNGEIWVFNKNYTQYIPLAIYDLQHWMGAPSIYVFDCSCAGSIVDSFQATSAPEYVQNCILMAACGADQILPMNPDLPADLFTSCLTTPLKMALRWFIQQNRDKLLSGVTLDMVDKIQGTFSDRRTMIGELNWIFTAITDTIAWDVLPRALFQRLFRQDLLVASLFRNFLLAERIMRTYNCTPVTHPKLPPTHHHPMWRAWDMAVDLCLSQLPDILEERAQFKNSTFFSEQLTAFEVWLNLDHNSHTNPAQLPIVLQVLLSPVHRLRALDLLGRFLNLGPWAVNSALSVGIFPYVLKLLQSNARDVRPFLVSIWAKILALDRRCQLDLVHDNYHRYFLSILADPAYDAHYRTMAAFVMTCIVRDFPQGQECAFQGSLIAICLEQINDPDPMLRRWLAICLGCSWDNYEDARWCGVRDSAHEKLYTILDDKVPEVRAAAIYALGTFINSSNERNDHANTIDHSIGLKLVSTSLYDSCVLVRHELVVALQYLVFAFENQFITLESSTLAALAADTSRRHTYIVDDAQNQVDQGISGCTPPSHHNVIATASAASKIMSNVYQIIWKAMYTLASDPHPRVACAATTIVDDIKSKIMLSVAPTLTAAASNEAGPTDVGSEDDAPSSYSSHRPPLITTEFVDWSARYFHGPDVRHDSNVAAIRPNGVIIDRNSNEHQQREWRLLRNMAFKKMSLEELQLVDPSQFDEPPLMQCRVPSTHLVAFHPFDPLLVSAGRDEFCLIRRAPCSGGVSTTSSMSTATGQDVQYVSFGLAPSATCPSGHHHHNNAPIVSCSSTARITALQLINAHDNTLVATGCSDGSVRIWRPLDCELEAPITSTSDLPQQHDYNSHHLEAQLVSAFNMMIMPDHHYYYNAPAVSVVGLGVGLSVGKQRQLSTEQFVDYHSPVPPLISTSGNVAGAAAANNNSGTNVNGLTMSTVSHHSANSVGMILLWQQHTCHMLAAGDTGEHQRVIRVWDARTEMKVNDIPTGADYGVTCLSSDGEHSLAAGFQDGSIRIYDQRMRAKHCRTFTYHKHTAPVLHCHAFRPHEKHISLVSGDTSGEVRFWDQRAPSSVKKLDVGAHMSAMCVHPNADIFACSLKASPNTVHNPTTHNVSSVGGATHRELKIYNLDGTSRASSVIRATSASMMRSLAWHPYCAKLAVTNVDSLSVYAAHGS